MRLSKAGAAFAVFALLVSACGGDDASSDGAEGGVGLSTDSDGVEDASVDGGEEPKTGGPVDGALVSVLSFDFGLYALDRDTGEETEMAVAGAGFSDREEQAFVTEDGSAAYLIVYTAVEGQSLTNDVALATIDMGTGAGEKLVEFGPNRESDDSLELTETRVIGPTGPDVWVQQKLFGEDEMSLIRFDATRGAETARIVSGPMTRSAIRW
jgi:hypothetical protein